MSKVAQEVAVQGYTRAPFPSDPASLSLHVSRELQKIEAAFARLNAAMAAQQKAVQSLQAGAK